MTTDPTTEDLSPCVAACLAALEQAQSCANACIRSGDRSLEACALAALDCASICEPTLGVLLRQSPHHGDFCALCQHICRVCAEACEQHQHAHCRRCAAACRACESACAVHAGERHALPGAHGR